MRSKRNATPPQFWAYARAMPRDVRLGVGPLANSVLCEGKSISRRGLARDAPDVPQGNPIFKRGLGEAGWGKGEAQLGSTEKSQVGGAYSAHHRCNQQTSAHGSQGLSACMSSTCVNFGSLIQDCRM